MLGFLNQLKSITRTPNATQNPLMLESGRASLAFTRSPSDSPYSMRATIPPRLASEMPAEHATSFPQQKSSTLIPPPHWHANQDETFLVASGRMCALVENKQTILSQDSEVYIPRGHYHTFSNASCEEPLVVDVKLSPDNRVRDERFFRNGYGYLDDCTRAKITPSPFQVLLFLYSADVIPALPGPRWVMKPLGRFIAWFGGVVVGKYLLGYREAYREYTP